MKRMEIDILFWNNKSSQKNYFFQHCIQKIIHSKSKRIQKLEQFIKRLVYSKATTACMQYDHLIKLLNLDAGTW